MQCIERPLLTIPPFILAGFVLTLVLQVFIHTSINRERNRIDYQSLAQPWHQQTYQGLSMGSDQLLSYLLAIRLQLHDNQAGEHLRYHHIDYDRLIAWLKRIYQLNPASEYSMFLASRIYSQTPDKQQLRKILRLIDQLFTKQPQLFWKYQAEATIIAKHQLGDLKLALNLAEKLFSQPRTIIMPQWARDMHFLLLADLNEYESSLSIIQGLLTSGTIKDPDEQHFLKEKLLYFQGKLSEIVSKKTELNESR